MNTSYHPGDFRRLSWSSRIVRPLVEVRKKLDKGSQNRELPHEPLDETCRPPWTMGGVGSKALNLCQGHVLRFRSRQSHCRLQSCLPTDDRSSKASVKAMYSASVVDKVTVGCKVAFQLTTDPPRALDFQDLLEKDNLSNLTTNLKIFYDSSEKCIEDKENWAKPRMRKTSVAKLVLVGVESLKLKSGSD
uniref:Uncharacterized protein n=1 Tax=Solanum lycopersicum TaxID=4081 RepID=A0A3Q7GUT2_SOLLC